MLTSLISRAQDHHPNLRVFAGSVTEVDMERAMNRRPGGRSGTNVRNQHYYELMRKSPHYPGTGNASAPRYIIAGCEAAFPWGKPGPHFDESMMPDAHCAAYLASPGLDGAEVQRIMDLI